ncbi:DUF1376 domain-containing protein [Tardiphaga sp.]|uniref:DUF1376 domain-containing protein n=1 Tax=Tardiphaga sp. TaxID=1926292 RepID=UPI00260E599F|nr:DUF1376 domain-containing protein [Tardiphaga sp.]MDB5617074.1 hypothetical protein [Tardiphaga sp.]
MAKLPDPLTPANLDLRGFTYMPLEVVRLRDSDLVVLASGEEFRAAVLLWCAAWHQVPAASVPKDERMLANLAGFGRDLKGWRGVSEAALRGFVECSDGRLYHPVIAEKAIESGSKKRKQTSQTAAATEARKAAKAIRDAERYEQRNDERNDERDDDSEENIGPDETERYVHQGNGTEGNGGEKNRTESKEKGERGARSELKLVSEEKPIPIDLSYEPSDAAIEYAYSLGMKKADLTLELSKFIAKAMTLRKVSFNPDMDFKLWCDHWLRFKLEKNPEWKPKPEPAPAPQEPFVLVVQGTPEGNAHCQYNREHGLRPPFFCRHIVDGVETIAAKCKWLIPPGYDEATGEKLAPSSEENAA